MEDPFKGIVHPTMIPQFTGTHPQALVVYDFISFPGEPVKIELIQLIPPGTPAIISQILLHESFCRLLTTVKSLFAFYCSFTAGEILASFEEDARSFLFPEPKLVPSFSGVEREVLMTRHPNFPVSAYLFTILI